MTWRLAATAALTLAVLLLNVSFAAAAGPRWVVDSMSNTTAQPGAALDYEVTFTNAGEEEMDGSQITVTAQLPTGLNLTEPATARLRVFGFGFFPCTQTDGTTPLAGGEVEFECQTSAPVHDAADTGGVENRMLLQFSAAVSSSAVSGTTISSRFTVAGGGAAPASTLDPVRVTESPPLFGLDAFDGLAAAPGGPAYTQAAGRPESLTTNLAFETYTNPLPTRGPFYPVEPFRDALVTSPAGLLGNPSAAQRCTLIELSNSTGSGSRPLCPPESQVGTATIHLWGDGLPNGQGPLPLFNMDPAPGEPARFGFSVLGNAVVLGASVRPDGRIVVGSRLVNQYLALNGSDVEFWNDPASPLHDPERACPGENAPSPGGNGPACPTTSPETAFLRMPTSCTAPGQGMQWQAAADSWTHPGAVNESGEPELADPAWSTASYTSHQPPGFPASPADPTTPWGEVAGVEGCASVPFEPEFKAEPTTNAPDSPSGLNVEISVPQHCWDAGQAESTCQSDLKEAKVELPKGMSVDPSSADGLSACSEAQFGLGSKRPVACPDAAKLGSVEVDSPLLSRYDAEGKPMTDAQGNNVPEPLNGAVYLAEQGHNPFGSLLALYLVVEGQGVRIKDAGEIAADPETGQLTTSFGEIQQLPFSHLRMDLFGGPRAALRTPASCGTYTANAALTPWARPGEPVARQSSFQISGCGAGGFDPHLAAGTENPLAGAFSPFSLRLSRGDGTQELGSLQATLPEGLLGKLAGIPYCPDSALASVSADLGSGAAQEQSPSCPAASQLGKVTVGAGAGSDPFYTQTGRAYLAGPYKGAPLSLAVVAPAVAGPFDLGSVVVRNALRIDPESARITAVSDPLPTILHGIPLDLKDVRVELNRPGFTLNPTSCEPTQITSTITSTQGATATPSERFQVGGCESLGFKPRLALRLTGKTRRTGNPALRATLTMPPGNANVARASVALPHSEFLDQGHIGTICTRVQYASGGGGGAGCPKGSVYGHAVAYSPLLGAPLEGNVYLRSSSHPLPDLVASLGGQIQVDLDGRIDSVHGGIRTTFEAVPDAPVSKFVLTMAGGRRSLLENSTDICAKPHRATVAFTAHNNKATNSRPLLKVAGCRKHARKHGGKKKHGGGRR